MRRVLFSIHGINTTGDWQAGIADVLGQFFDYRQLKYRDYCKLPLAVWRLGGDVIFFVISVVVVWFLPLNLATRAKALAVLFLLAFVINIWNQMVMKRTVGWFHRQLEASGVKFGRPSVIAHSLGTLVLARAMSRFDGLSVGTVILDGCVVQRAYPWEGPGNRFQNVYNEIGGKDPVPLIAGLLRFTVPRIGDAGAKGFVGPNVDTQHWSPSDVGPVIYRGQNACCEPHRQVQSSYRVHNIRFGEVEHSGYHQGVSHARDFWLPRLLGYDPILFQAFHSDCKAVVIAESGPLADYNRLQANFLDSCYGWQPGNMRSVMLAHLASLADGRVSSRDLDDFTYSAVKVLTSSVTETADLLPSPKSDRDPIKLPELAEERWNLLDPRIATYRAVITTLEVWP